uniref:Thyroid hormone receptor-associated protein complex subunit n=1 Tax=Anopheles coluzzii TaxID=1518534 RepID=A0A6E8W2X2_ANOCL|nr:alpha-protein kinase 1-like isoform X1 [Anopheles coluzzii]
MSANLAAIDELVEEFLKMELISVPPYPGQLGYLGSTKVNDFRTPLMPIPANNSNKNSNQSQRHQSQPQQREQQQQQAASQQQQQLPSSQPLRSHHHNNSSSHHHHHHHHHHQQLLQREREAKQQQRELEQQQQQQQLLQQQQQRQQQLQQQQQQQYYSENQYPLEPATIALTASPHEDALQKLTQRLESELRIAKRQHLACTEVLLPADLLPRISAEMFEQSEKEPCGIRGCTIYIEFEDEPDNTRRIATMKTDPNTVSTFELYLTLKQDRRGWTSILPQFLKNLARGSTIMISPEFRLTKNKLYHAYAD